VIHADLAIATDHTTNRGRLERAQHWARGSEAQLDASVMHADLALQWAVSSGEAITALACAEARLALVIHADLALATDHAADRGRLERAQHLVRGAERLDTFVIHADLTLATDHASDRGRLERAQHLVR